MLTSLADIYSTLWFYIIDLKKSEYIFYIYVYMSQYKNNIHYT